MKAVRLLASCFLTVLAFTVSAQTLPPVEHGVKDAIPTAKPPRNRAWSYRIPLNRRYSELTAEERKIVHAQYESLAVGDEPPFPLEGYKPLVQAMTALQKAMMVWGELSLIALIDAEGNPQSVSAYGSPSPEMTKAAATVLMLTKFKPAVCAGKPCAMEFPFRLDFRLK
ncbi:energy transducer TonB [Niveibacterium terrae]|uniref:energy transducer TonB n=1 Tax=Niveibacterium terrae TaxID=3373598 RepID=UPI003A9104BB